MVAVVDSIAVVGNIVVDMVVHGSIAVAVDIAVSVVRSSSSPRGHYRHRRQLRKKALGFSFF